MIFGRARLLAEAVQITNERIDNQQEQVRLLMQYCDTLHEMVRLLHDEMQKPHNAREHSEVSDTRV